MANYYQLASDVKRKLNKLQYLGNYSLIKTLAAKHKVKKSAILKRLKQGNELNYRYKTTKGEKTISVFQLKHLRKTPTSWEMDEIPNLFYLTASKSELVRRLNAKECEYCTCSYPSRQVHHVRKLKDLKKKPNFKLWQKVMIARNRKTMILCNECHKLLHAGKLPDTRFKAKYI